MVMSRAWMRAIRPAIFVCSSRPAKRRHGSPEQALQQISQTVAGLDELYREIATKVPNLTAEKMRAGDARSAIFAVVLKPSAGATADDSSDDVAGPRIDFVIEGVDVRACFEFTQDLKTNDLSYKKFVEVTVPGKENSTEQISTFSVEAKDRRLCIVGLEPGKTYDLKLLNDLPSRQGGKLGEPVVVSGVRLPDLPQQVAFSGRNFILPTSGPGEVALHAINVDRFDLELFRITDRTLHRQIALGYIGGELPQREYVDLRERFAEPLGREASNCRMRRRTCRSERFFKSDRSSRTDVNG